MKHLIRLLTLCLLACGTPMLATAVCAAAPKEADGKEDKASAAIKIGVLDWQQLLAKAPQAEAAGKRLEKEFRDRKDKLMGKQKEFQTKQEKLQRDRDTMSATELARSEKDLTKLQQDLRHLDEELRSDYTARHREEMDDFIKLVRDVVDKLAAEERYDLVVPQEATLFMNERIDVTEKVLQRLANTKSAKSDPDKERDKK